VAGVDAASLRNSVGCEIVLETEPDYDQLRASFNGTIDRRPAAIVRPQTTVDVQAAVRWAANAGMPIAVRGGGHSVAGHCVADGGLVIDLRLMREVTVDPVARRARVGGGALWEDVDRVTMAHDLALPGGTFGDTGVGGLTLGGGIGYILGSAGLTCDNLLAAEVVTADGSVVAAGPDGDPELLWALRGGGGNFGVVTSFKFGLHPVGPLFAGKLDVPLAAAREALRASAAIALVAPPRLMLAATGPAIAESGSRMLGLIVSFQGSAEEADPLLRPLRALPLARDGLATMSYLELQAMSGQLPFGLRHYWKGHFLRDLDEAAIEAVVGAMESAVGSDFVLMEAITGRAREEPVGGAAFGQREARWNVSALAIWEDPAQDAAHIEWARRAAEDVGRSSLTGAGYANYAPPDESSDRVRAMFGSERLERLSRVKRRYDPDNLFRFNLNIAPTL
jgi:FAD/FMN-containing dehydrogenase